MQTLGPVFGAGDGEGDAGGADPGLGAGQAGGHGGFVVEECAGNVGGGQARDGAQRQRHAGFGVTRRVAAGENQAQAVVGNHLGVLGCLIRRKQGQGLGLGLIAGAAAQTVDGFAKGHPDQPGHRVLRHTGTRPMNQRRGGGVLQGVLGQLKVADTGNEGRQDPPPIGAQGLIQNQGGIGGEVHQ